MILGQDVGHLEFKMADTQIVTKHILSSFLKFVPYLYMNYIPFNFRGQGPIYPLNVGYLEFKMADTEAVIMDIVYYKYCVVHISETNEVRDLIFGTGTPWDLENKIFDSGH